MARQEVPEPIVRTERLGKRYGRRTALADCTLEIPGGRIVALVGPNGAGKSTLLNLICGLIQPSEGSVRVLGERPGVDVRQLARVAFVAQDTPVYPSLTVDDHLRLGARLNPRWDSGLAQGRVERLGLDPRQRAGRLSGGQRAQLALTLAAAKRPELLVLDEPVAALDPLARREFLQSLMSFVADLEVSVVLSSHLINDLERVCDHLVVLATGNVQVTGDVEHLRATHHRLIGARGALDDLPPDVEVIQSRHTDRQSSLVVRTSTAGPPGAGTVEPLDLEEMVLAYMSRDLPSAAHGSPAGVR